MNQELNRREVMQAVGASVICGLAVPAASAARQETAKVKSKLGIHIFAHNDDFFNLHGESAYDDIKDGSFRLILTTAGDADFRNGWWEAGELAAIACIRSLLPRSPLTIRVEQIKGQAVHPIVKYSFNGMWVYCMRVPNPIRSDTGNGLWKLRSDPRFQLSAVDNSTTYSSWSDFCNTLKEIVVRESQLANCTPWLHAPHCKSGGGINNKDHVDHTATGLAVQSFASGLKCTRSWVWGYAIEELRRWTLSNADREHKDMLGKKFLEVLKAAVNANGDPPELTGPMEGTIGNQSKYLPYSHAETVFPEDRDPYPP